MLIDILLKNMIGWSLFACVPYSFAITASGEIFDGKNLEHHTDICAQNNLEYDRVLKPEYQIWNRQLKDMEPTLDYFTSNGKRCAFVKDGMLKEKFYRIAENHVNKKFPDWKTGLNYFEENWDIVKPHADKLCTNIPVLVSPTTVKEKIILTGTAAERLRILNNQLFDRIQIEELVPYSLNRKFIGKFELFEFLPDSYWKGKKKWSDRGIVFYCNKVFSFYDFVQMNSKGNTIKHIMMAIQYEIKHMVSLALERGYIDLTVAVKPDEIWTFDMFMKHWSKKENRVECWQS